MPVPATGGQLRTKIQDMQVGDYIACYWGYRDVTQKAIAYLGNDSYMTSEFSLTGEALIAGSNAGFKKFYLVKVDQGLLISDRVLQNTISWDLLNTHDMVQGFSKTLKDNGNTGLSYDFIIRSLGGGNSYRDADGKSSTTDKGIGAWPTDNEYDKYVNGMFEGRDDVWHWSNPTYGGTYSWCWETPVLSTSNRILRSGAKVEMSAGSANAYSWFGFRPVFEYQEVTP